METLGDYVILRELGQGAFGEVYLAEHRFIKQTFALKVLPESVSQDPTFLRRFTAKIADIADIDHPNIVKIHNVSCSEGRYFIVSDPYVDSFGQTMNLARYLQLKGQSFTEDEIFHFLSQVAGALDAAHEKGIVHGSLRLSHILVGESNGEVALHVSDLGVVHLLGEHFVMRRLIEQMGDAFALLDPPEHARTFMQSFAFLSPEQKAFLPSAKEASVDAYAFGVLAYYLLLRKWPEGCFEVVAKGLPEAKLNWDLLISRLLQHSPMARPSRLGAALQDFVHAPKTFGKEIHHLSELEPKVESVQQMAFEFPVEAPSEELVEASPKPVFKPQEIARPEYEADPAAVFQRELAVSHYTPKKDETTLVTPILTDMVVVPGGTYYRGSNDGARDEAPRHAIRLTPFAIDIHPVTNEQFVRFLQVMGGEKDHNNNDIIRLKDARIKRSAGKLTIESGYARHPVVGVTWYGATAYAKWVGKRLPTEAEWEVAAVSGRDTGLYPTGDDIERTQANFFSSDTTPVCSYPPNALGLYDMAGNVYDWCHDWYAYNYYDTSSIEPDQPKGPNQGVYRVLRGGCWKSLKEDLRCAHRHRNNPGAVNGTYGFRLAANVV